MKVIFDLWHILFGVIAFGTFLYISVLFYRISCMACVISSIAFHHNMGSMVEISDRDDRYKLLPSYWTYHSTSQAYLWYIWGKINSLKRIPTYQNIVHRFKIIPTGITSKCRNNHIPKFFLLELHVLIQFISLLWNMVLEFLQSFGDFKIEGNPVYCIVKQFINIHMSPLSLSEWFKLMNKWST